MIVRFPVLTFGNMKDGCNICEYLLIKAAGVKMNCFASAQVPGIFANFSRFLHRPLCASGSVKICWAFPPFSFGLLCFLLLVVDWRLEFWRVGTWRRGESGRGDLLSARRRPEHVELLSRSLHLRPAAAGTGPRQPPLLQRLDARQERHDPRLGQRPVLLLHHHGFPPRHRDHPHNMWVASASCFRPLPRAFGAHFTSGVLVAGDEAFDLLMSARYCDVALAVVSSLESFLGLIPPATNWWSMRLGLILVVCARSCGERLNCN